MRKLPMALPLSIAGAAALLIPAPVTAQSQSSRFHEAYYLENEGGDLEKARELYLSVAKRSSDKELRWHFDGFGIVTEEVRAGVCLCSGSWE